MSSRNFWRMFLKQLYCLFKAIVLGYFLYIEFKRKFTILMPRKYCYKNHLKILKSFHNLSTNKYNYAQWWNLSEFFEFAWLLILFILIEISFLVNDKWNKANVTEKSEIQSHLFCNNDHATIINCLKCSMSHTTLLTTHYC